MLPLVVNHRRMFVVKILFWGMLLNSLLCETSATHGTCRVKNTLFVSGKKLLSDPCFPSGAISHEDSETKLCFNIQKNNTQADCCHDQDFNCSIQMQYHTDNTYKLILNKEILSKQDIVVMVTPDANFLCMPGEFRKDTGFLLNIHKCLDTGNTNLRLSQDDLCEQDSSYDEEACKGVEGTQYKLIVESGKKRCVSCKAPEKKPDMIITVPVSDSSNATSPQKAAGILRNLSSLLEHMGNSSTASIVMGNIKGVITKLPQQNQTSISFGIAENGDVNILGKNNKLMDVSRSVHIPKEACEMAVKGNGSFVGVLLFPGMRQDETNSFFLNYELVGIEMGAKISNLTQTVDIHYSNVDKNGSIASCRSWSGQDGEPKWITDGCQTKETNGSISCHCTHLTFFAILMSPAPHGNISSSDFKSLSYITSIGCGLSMFFLAVGLFMHYLLRKGKASQATKILINLFIAMFSLNLSFLINETIANLGNFGACVAIAAVLHYSMLATFTWFFMQALHLYFKLLKIPSEIKHYMMKICITAWAVPAVVVIALLASQKYNFLVIYTDDGNSAKMCWISDAAVHQGVNVAYYAVVFVFTFSIFIVTVLQIVRFKSAAVKGQDSGSTKANCFSILGLFLLLGITWAFAFFSHGPLLIPSYYIFTILNTFQGFFLFIYYYKSGKTVGEDNKLMHSSSSSPTSNTTVTSPYG